MNAWFAGVIEALTPWKEVIGSAFAALAAAGALVSGVLKQRSRPDATFPIPPVPVPVAPVRMAHEDLSEVRSFVGDLREAVEDLARETRRNVAAQRLIERGLFTVVWKDFGGKPRPVTRVTGKGIVHYAKALGVKPPVPSAQALLPGF